MNPPSVVTSSSSSAPTGVAVAEFDGDDAVGVDGVTVCGGVEGATDGVVEAETLGPRLADRLEIGWAVPHATATTESSITLADRRFKGTLFGADFYAEVPRTADDVKDRA